MKAYGELGFSYKDIKDQSERIFDLLNLDKEERKTFRGLFCKEIVVNKTRINRLLGSWNPVYHSMKIGDAVKDIPLWKRNCYGWRRKTVGTYLYAPDDGNSLIDLRRREKLMDRKEKLEVTLLKKSDCFDKLNTRKQIIYDIGCKSTKKCFEKASKTFYYKEQFHLE